MAISNLNDLIITVAISVFGNFFETSPSETILREICQVLALMISHVKHGDDMFNNFHL